MKRLLLGAAILAMASPAWGQIQADYAQEVLKDCGIQPSTKNDDLLVVKLCHPPVFDLLDDVVAVADKIGISNSSDLTSPISVLTSRNIRNRNQGVIADLLRTIPGLSVSQSGGAGALTQIRLRGSEANHILSLIHI